MACQVCHYKTLQINPLYGQVSQLSEQVRSYCKNLIGGRTNRIVMKNCCQQQDKSYCNEKLLSAAGLHKDVPVAALRRCAKSRCPDISDRIAKS